MQGRKKEKERHKKTKRKNKKYKDMDKADLFLHGQTKDKEGNIKDIQWAPGLPKRPKTKVDPDAPGTPGEPGYDPPVKREDLDEKGKKKWDELRKKKSPAKQDYMAMASQAGGMMGGGNNLPLILGGLALVGIVAYFATKKK